MGIRQDIIKSDVSLVSGDVAAGQRQTLGRVGRQGQGLVVAGRQEGVPAPALLLEKADLLGHIPACDIAYSMIMLSRSFSSRSIRFLFSRSSTMNSSSSSLCSSSW